MGRIDAATLGLERFEIIDGLLRAINTLPKDETTPKLLSRAANYLHIRYENEFDSMRECLKIEASK